MITVPEKNELRSLCAGKPRALDLIDKIDAVETDCHSCGHKRIGGNYCVFWQAEVPIHALREGCADWFYDEIPF